MQWDDVIEQGVIYYCVVLLCWISWGKHVTF